MTRQIFGFLLAIAIFCSLASAHSGLSLAQTPIPARVLNQIEFEIQKTMSYTLGSESNHALWTPRVIELQSVEGAPQPLSNPYQPHEVIYQLRFDVGMGHNMSEDIYHWRRCRVQISDVDGTWSDPRLQCETTTPDPF